jgi:DNA-directed RNA polymerase specialized sigma24 family protein
VHRIWLSRDEELPELPSWRWACEHETDLEQLEVQDLIQTMLQEANLTFQERITLYMLFVDGAPPMEVARRFKVSYERVGQIRNKALRKCRGYMRKAGLDLPAYRIRPKQIEKPTFVPDPAVLPLLGRGYWMDRSMQ